MSGRGHGADGLSRAAVLEALRQAPGSMPVAELAQAVGLSVNAVRFHLDRLVPDGMVRAVPEASRGRPGRPRMRYRAMPPEAVEAVAGYRMLAGLLAGQVSADGGTEGALEAGRRWADDLISAHPDLGRATGDELPRLVELLDQAGFQPRTVEGGAAVELHACPFIDLARDRPEVICTLHVGMVRRLLDRWALSGQSRLTAVLDGSGPCLLQLRT